MHIGIACNITLAKLPSTHQQQNKKPHMGPEWTPCERPKARRVRPATKEQPNGEGTFMQFQRSGPACRRASGSL